MSILLADIDATGSALGYHDGNKYYIEDDALQSLKVIDDISLLYFFFSIL